MGHAEVSRRVLLETLEPGQYEVCVDDMVASVVPDSVRVKGTGFVTILGVRPTRVRVWVLRAHLEDTVWRAGVV